MNESMYAGEKLDSLDTEQLKLAVDADPRHQPDWVASKYVGATDPSRRGIIGHTYYAKHSDGSIDKVEVYYDDGIQAEYEPLDGGAGGDMDEGLEDSNDGTYPDGSRLPDAAPGSKAGLMKQYNDLFQQIKTYKKTPNNMNYAEYQMLFDKLGEIHDKLLKIGVDMGNPYDRISREKTRQMDEEEMPNTPQRQSFERNSEKIKVVRTAVLRDPRYNAWAKEYTPQQILDAITKVAEKATDNEIASYDLRTNKKIDVQNIPYASSYWTEIVRRLLKRPNMSESKQHKSKEADEGNAFGKTVRDAKKRGKKTARLGNQTIKIKESSKKCCCEGKGKKKCPVHGKVDENMKPWVKAAQARIDKEHPYPRQRGDVHPRQAGTGVCLCARKGKDKCPLHKDRSMEEGKKWVAKAVKGIKKGALRKQEGKKKGQKFKKGELKSLAKSGTPLEKKRAQFALNISKKKK
jgi:hypothetical protein